MPKIKSCHFNMDTACIDVELENGGKFSLYTVGAEENLCLAPITSDKLNWLIDNEPEAYVKRVLDGTIQKYVDNVEKRTNNCENNIRKSLEKHYSLKTAMTFRPEAQGLVRNQNGQ